MGWRELTPWANVNVEKNEKNNVWGCSVHTHLGCNNLPSTVNDLATTILKNTNSTNFHSTAIMKHWKKKNTNANFGILKKKKDWFRSPFCKFEVQTVFFVLLLGSLVGVSSVQFCLICSMIQTNFPNMSWTLDLFLTPWAMMWMLFLCFALQNLTACYLRAPYRLKLLTWALERSLCYPKWAVNADLTTGPSASRSTLSMTSITDGNARIRGRKTFPALTLAWLHIEPSPCGENTTSRWPSL